MKRHTSPCCLFSGPFRGESKQLGRRYPDPGYSSVAGSDPGWTSDRRADKQHGHLSYGGQTRGIAIARGQVRRLRGTRYCVVGISQASVLRFACVMACCHQLDSSFRSGYGTYWWGRGRRNTTNPIIPVGTQLRGVVCMRGLWLP